MNVKPNYKKGRREEITKLLLTLGLIPYKSLRYFEGENNIRTYQRLLRKMEQEGILKFEDEPIKYVYPYYITKRTEIQNSIPREYIESYESRGKEQRQSAKKSNISYRKRCLTIADTQMFMHASGIRIFPDQKPDLFKNNCIIDADNSYFYASHEHKKISGYVDKVTEENGSKIVQASRCVGTLLSDGRIYAIYNIDDTLVVWKKRGEEKIVRHIISLFSKRYAPLIGQANAEVSGAIVLAENNYTICSLITNDNDFTINIDYAYGKMYALTLDKYGRELMTKICEPNFEKRLKETVLSKDEMKNSQHVRVACDGYNQTDDVYSLVFCIPDICKLKHFLNAAKREDLKAKFRIYCYTHQLPLIMHLAKNTAEIYHAPIDEEEENQDEE